MGRAASTDRQSRPGVIRRRLDRALARSHARIALRPHDPGTGEEIDKREIVKGYEYGLSDFLTAAPELAAGGNRIRTIGPAEKKTAVERGPRPTGRWRDLFNFSYDG